MKQYLLMLLTITIYLTGYSQQSSRIIFRSDSTKYICKAGKELFIKLTVIGKINSKVRLVGVSKIGDYISTASIEKEILYSKKKKGGKKKLYCGFDGGNPISGISNLDLQGKEYTFYSFIFSECIKEVGYYKLRFVIDILFPEKNKKRKIKSDWIEIQVL